MLTFDTASPAQQTLRALRRCGHHLHHNVARDTPAEEILSCLTENEQTVLRELLTRCLDSWTKEQAESPDPGIISRG